MQPVRPTGITLKLQYDISDTGCDFDSGLSRLIAFIIISSNFKENTGSS